MQLGSSRTDLFVVDLETALFGLLDFGKYDGIGGGGGVSLGFVALRVLAFADVPCAVCGRLTDRGIYLIGFFLTTFGRLLSFSCITERVHCWLMRFF